MLTDLNTLIPANSGLQLIFAFGINTRGQIDAWAFQFGTGNVHAVLLTPHHSTSTTQDTASAASAEIAGRTRVTLSENVRKMLRERLAGRYDYRGFAR